MRVKIDVMGSMGLVFSCSACGAEMEQFHPPHHLKLQHPTHDGVIFKGKEIGCPFAGKSFAWPFIQELTPL